MPCLKKIINENEVEIQNKLEKIKASVKLCTAVLLALELGRFLARKLLETELLERNKEKCTWPRCEKCRARLENKKSKDRSIKSLVGTIRHLAKNNHPKAAMIDLKVEKNVIGYILEKKQYRSDVMEKR